jgi:putative oxidoreductase
MSLDNRTAPYAVTLLRVTLGALFMAHAALKILVITPAGTAGFFAKLGLPPELAYVTIAGEVIGGGMLILGVYARLAALALVPLLLGTIITVHGHNGFFFTNAQGGWEYPAVWTVALIAQALLGDGALALWPTVLLRNTSSRPARA